MVGRDDPPYGLRLLIRDAADFRAHADYIHFNPVKHGLVTRVRDWPHSSFHRFVRAGRLPADWGGDRSDGPGAGRPETTSAGPM